MQRAEEAEEAQQAEENEGAQRAEEAKGAQRAKEVEGAAENVKTITELFNEAYMQDPIPNDVLEQLRRGQTRSKQISLAECQIDNSSHPIPQARLRTKLYAAETAANKGFPRDASSRTPGVF